MEQFIDSIEQGTDEPMCLSLIGKAFKSENPSDVLISLMQTGIIE